MNDLPPLELPEAGSRTQSLYFKALAVWCCDDRDGAIRLLEEAAAAGERTPGPRHPHLGRVLVCLGIFRRTDGRLEEAETCFRRALAIAERTLGREHLEAWAARRALMECLETAGKRAESLRLSIHAPETPEIECPEPASEAERLRFAALDARMAGHLAEERRLLEEALAAGERTLGREHPHVADILENLASVEEREGRLHPARERMRQALAIRERLDGPNGDSIRLALCELARLYREDGEPARAEPLCRRALEIAQRRGTIGALRTYPRFELAACLEALGNTQEAEWQRRQGRLDMLLRHPWALEWWEPRRRAAIPAGVINAESAARLERVTRMGLEAEERYFGPEQPRVRPYLEMLALVLEKLDRTAEAEQVRAEFARKSRAWRDRTRGST
jgi:tetratricopeptide (TPR) repeat protein